jgi:hypothetical protein
MNLLQKLNPFRPRTILEQIKKCKRTNTPFRIHFKSGCTPNDMPQPEFVDFMTPMEGGEPYEMLTPLFTDGEFRPCVVHLYDIERVEATTGKTYFPSTTAAELAAYEAHATH